MHVLSIATAFIIWPPAIIVMFTVAQSHLHSPAIMFPTILRSHFRVALHWLPGGRYLGHIKEFGQPHLTTAITGSEFPEQASPLQHLLFLCCSAVDYPRSQSSL